jgi:1-acyl-sn-glycerol-3-phosphate acyltransferase
MTTQDDLQPYVHASLERRRRLLRWLLKHVGWRFFARIDRVEGVEHVPAQGPAILIINHIAFLDPIAVLGHVPRNVVPIAKAESSMVPFWGMFAAAWRPILVQRNGADHEAVARTLAVLRAGEIVLVAPEATRSPTLRQAGAGIAHLAYRSGAPIVPVAVEGTEGFPTLSRERWRRPGVELRFGRPMKLKTFADRPTREDMQAIADEAMAAVAAMLPPHRRGIYANAVGTVPTYLEIQGLGTRDCGFNP